MSHGERRLAAIMFTDMVGYTALAQSNEPTAMELLVEQRRVLRPYFAKNNGREVKTIGDAFLVEFASSIMAVKCAFEIQSSLHAANASRPEGKKLLLRIGIHLGDVIHSDGDITGDAVNVASRIQALAPIGGVCLTEQVYESVVNKVEYTFETLGTPELKNVSRPIEVYQISGLGQTMSRPRLRKTSLPKNKVAVLPLVNMTNDPNEEYFVDGMTEEMISTLSNISGLAVISRTSAMQYKGVKKSLVDIGRELGVGTLLEGSVRKAGNRVRITVQLLDASEDKHLWAQSYDRELQDVFAVQSDVATNVADTLKVRLLDREAAQIKKKHSESIEAYTLYLKGRSLLIDGDKEGILGSLKPFQEAIEMEPDYARAYSGLADAYLAAATYGFMDVASGLAKSIDTAMKALGLDDTIAEAHASLALNLVSGWRWEEAEREFRRAIELNPSYASAHQWYSICLQDMGRMTEAIEEMEKARELDPLSPAIAFWVGQTNFYTRRLDEAIAVYDKLIEKEPTFAFAHLTRAACFILKGMKEKASVDFEALNRFGQNEDVNKAVLAILYEWSGEKEKALPMIKELIQKVGNSGVWAERIAEWYAVSGDREEFFNWIDKAITAKRISVSHIRYCPGFDKVRDDSRFPGIFNKLGVPS